MTQFRRLGYAAALTAPLFALGCESSTDDEEPPAGNEITCEANFCTVPAGTYTDDLTFTADNTYFLDGKVFIGDGTSTNTLTIEAGTTVQGRASQSVPGALVIQQNAQINANGTADNVIVFTSDQGGDSAAGDWGGLIINGKAPINGCDSAPCTAIGEGDTGVYGGSEPGDSSGTIRYIRVEWAGTKLTAESEFNGIALQGVGSGTTVEYVQVHKNADDGIEFYGGTVNAKWIVITGAQDDSIDWTEGWVGNVQFALVKQLDGSGDQGIEADNNGDNNALEPRSNPTISNLTLIGDAEADIGMLLREGTQVSIYNAIVTGFGDACLALDQASTFELACAGGALTGNLNLEGVVLNCETTYKEPEDENDMPLEGLPCSVEEFFGYDAEVKGNMVMDPMLSNYMLPEGSELLDTGAPPADPWFDSSATFYGAVGADDWTAGWALYLD